MIHTLYELYQKHPKVVTDSRQIENDCLFFALRGERFNGNEYAREALAKGAAYVVIDDAAFFVEDGRHLLVPDTLVALQELAKMHREHIVFPVLAITGSNGKTTTKELVAAVLSTTYRTYFTKGNLNNHIGVPLTLLSIPKDCEIAIIEMGANHLGEIAFLCEIAKPTHGLVTNMGKAHLEGFGGEEGVRRGKSELYHYLATNQATAFVNIDESHLEERSAICKYRVRYRKDESFDHPTIHQVHFLGAAPFVEVAYADDDRTRLEARTQLVGAYNFNNIMTAIVVGRYFKVSGNNIKYALENYQPTNNRSQLVKKGGNTYILDAYNANPTSMEVALRHLSSLSEKGGKTVAVLGDMFELGESAAAEHRAVLALARSLPLEHLITIGNEFGKISPENGWQHFDNTTDLKKWLSEQEGKDYTILLKASRGMKLETLLL